MVRREPPLTFGGALRILGHYESPTISKLDRLLGGTILAAGGGAGIAAVSGTALAPLAVLGALWGWIDQKNEAVGLLRTAVASVGDKLAGTGGHERRRLIAAAHTTMVVAAYFEVLDQVAGRSLAKLQITEAEKESLTVGRWRAVGEPLYDFLYSAEVPAPSATRGFEENVVAVENWMMLLERRLETFVEGLTDGRDIAQVIRAGLSVRIAVEKYRSLHLRMASTVPEFMAWATLGEHAATRASITSLRADISAAVDTHRSALGRIEAVLGLIAPAMPERTDLLSVIERANRGVLDQPIVDVGVEPYDTNVVFPTVKRGYVNQRYRIADAGDHAWPASERWWKDRRSRPDLDLALTAHFLSVDATRRPLLLLGHPGAGKSMLTKVLAARLPASAYTVVRVPLRRVGANAPIVEQVQQSLNLATNHRVEWWRLAEQSQQTTRVLLLDGLDELLQAASSDRGGYLQEVMDFQRVEADQERPVIVVVTSRTVVADRIDIPDGTAVIKLDPFTETEIKDWLRGWHEANASSIEAGNVRELSLAAALAHADLAQQPLLLLMLALYAADPESAPLDADVSTAELYGRLLDNFARREVAKRSTGRVRPEQLAGGVKVQLRRLSVAALGMFNRGRQDIAEAELGTDLYALGDPSAIEPAQEGQRIIGEFFFVHAAQAQELSTVRRSESVRRCYEFLHATFGEYLVAARIMDELIDVAETALSGRHPRDPDDDLLFALLSHRALAGRRSILTFAAELSVSLTALERQRVLDVLETLLATCRRRHTSDRYATYRPRPVDRVRELAEYSANLTALRVVLAPTDDPVPLARLSPESGEATQAWHSMVSLWRAGLDAEDWQAMLAILQRDGDVIVPGHDRTASSEVSDIWAAKLLGDSELESRLRYGFALNDNTYYWDEEDRWIEFMRSWLIPAIVRNDPSPQLLREMPSGTPKEEVAEVAGYLMRLLRNRNAPRGIDEDGKLLRFLLDLPRVFDLDPYALAAAIIEHPELIEKVPELNDHDLYAKAKALPLVIELPETYPQATRLQSKQWETFRTMIRESGNAWPQDTEWKDLLQAVASLLIDFDFLKHK
jgi:hypothetical protein